MEAGSILLNKEGKLIIDDGLEKEIMLVPHKQIKVIVNGEEASSPVSITAKDQVELLPREKGDEAEIIVQISPDRLSAYVKLIPEVKVIPDIEVEQTLYKVTVKASSRLVQNYSFTIEQIRQALADKGVCFGINEDNKLHSILNNPTPSRVLVAKGIPYQPGVDESVNILFDTEKNCQPEVLPDGRVDFKQKRIVTVEKGAVLAEKVPGKPGQPGTGVDGEPINPPDYKKIVLRAGEGTALKNDGASVVAVKRGLPSFHINKDTWEFRVNPVYEVEEVTIGTGNLEFNGHIVVHKNVAEGMSVFGAGDVNIEGAVYGAKIAALGNVNIEKNVLSSFINAGGMTQYLKDTKKNLQCINNALIQIVELGGILKERCDQLNKEVCLGQLIVGLINKKFTDVPKVITQIEKILKEQQFVVSSELESLVTELKVKFRRLGWLKVKSVEEVKRFQERVSAVISSLEAQDSESKGNVKLSYAVNSNIEAEGDVHVTGKGCINTNINARGNVIVDGVFRGGSISCKGTIKIKEAGSEMGVRTIIKTSAGYIKIDKAHQNVIVSAGSNSKNINNTEYKVFIN